MADSRGYGVTREGKVRHRRQSASSPLVVCGCDAWHPLEELPENIHLRRIAMSWPVCKNCEARDV